MGGGREEDKNKKGKENGRKKEREKNSSRIPKPSELQSLWIKCLKVP